MFALVRKIGSHFRKETVRTVTVPLLSSKRLGDKGIIVTGGGNGIGFAIAKKFKEEGARVLICGRNEEKLKTASGKIGCAYLQLDLTDPSRFNDFITKATTLLGGIDVLVNNAGVSLHERSFLDVTPEGFEQQVKTNFEGPFFLTQEFIKYLKENNRKGNVLFVSSETGDTADIRPYGLTKAAINSLVQGLAHAYKLDGIRVNAIAPGITATNMTGVSNENLYAGRYGAGRYYLPEEMAEVATFLVSDVSNIISGQIITCNNAETVNARWKK